MFAFLRPSRRQVLIDRLHAAVVASSRRPELYGGGGFPDTVEGRFEALVLHVLLVLRRLRQLPQPASEVAQDLVDSVFAHLEIAMRESGVGDMGVPKKMKKLGRAFYDRTAKYEAALERGDATALSEELARRLGLENSDLEQLSLYLLSLGSQLESQDLEALLASPQLPPPPSGIAQPEART